MYRFVAVKVGKGDAFYIENMGISFLVDGGASQKNLPLLLSSASIANDIDIVVCTHSDEDHVNGLIGYFESGKTSKEVWLPGSWMSRLEDMLDKPQDFIKELYENINDLDDGFLINSDGTLEQIGDSISLSQSDKDVKLDNGTKISPPLLPYKNQKTNGRIEYAQNESRFDKGIKTENTKNEWPEEPVTIKNTLFSRENFSLFASKKISTPTDHFLKKNINQQTIIQQKISFNRNKIFNSSINAAEKILKLATLAYNSGAKVRWFKYSNIESGGGIKYFHPVNSIEIFQARRRLALEFICLTKANIESLVFYAYNENHSAGVLFCADSNFSFQQPLNFLSECRNLIVTAPHHGAEANKVVYQKLAPYINPNTIFVRSDTQQSKTKKKPRPCQDYKNLPYSRYCTICFAQQKKQDVILTYTAGRWSPNSTTGCIC